MKASLTSTDQSVNVLHHKIVVSKSALQYKRYKFNKLNGLKSLCELLCELLLVHEVKALVGQQRSEALAQVIVGIFCESHLLHRRQLAVARPDLLTGRAQVLHTHTHRGRETEQ